MEKYHKIKTVFLRDPDNKYKTLLEGQYALPEFEYLKDNDWTFTEKIHGTNIRVIWQDGLLRFEGRTDKASMPKFLLKKLEHLFLREENHTSTLMLDVLPELDACLYGEGYGARIQKGGGNYISDGVSFVLFDIKVGNIWLERHNIDDIAKTLGIDVVPVVGEGTLQDGVEMVRMGMNSTFGNFPAEGIVMKPKIELINRRGNRVITKIKHKDFLRS